MEGMRNVIQRDCIVARSCVALGAVPRYVPFAPALHQLLCIGPGAFAHLDLANVGEQALRAPAQDVLLNAHDGYEADDRREDCDGRNPNASTPTYMGGHATLDTAEVDFVPRFVYNKH